MFDVGSYENECWEDEFDILLSVFYEVFIIFVFCVLYVYFRYILVLSYGFFSHPVLIPFSPSLDNVPTPFSLYFRKSLELR